MKHPFVKKLWPLLVFWLMCSTAGAGKASIQTQAGPYYIELVTNPAPITLGKSQLLLRLTDSSGKPVEGAKIRSLTKMPDMNMGEREVTATAKPGQPGVYTAPATFAMEGGYVAILRIEGPQGAATVEIPLKTGQDTGTLPEAPVAGVQGPSISDRGFSFLALLTWIGGGLFVAFVIYRIVKTGQRPNWRGIFNRQVIGGLLLLAIFLVGAIYAVNRFRRPGAMTPIEAQAMQMELPAPAGTAPVELATVVRGSIENTVRYTGQAVGYVEQDVTPRVTGTIIEMKVYTGDRVKRGQILARLDVTQSAPQVANQRAALNMAQQGVGVAQKEHQQALAEVTEERADAAMKQSALEGARADLIAAQEERANAQAELEAAQSMLPDAEAQLEAAQADQHYWQQEIARMQKLLDAKAVTQEEYQQERAQAQNADAKVRQAQARITQAQAQVRAAQSSVRKSDAMLASARSKIAQVQSDLRASQARIRSAQAMAASARQRIAQAQAGVEQAQAALAGASATQGYSILRALTDGVVTERVISPGVLVNPGQTILRVAQIMPIRLQANVAESDLSRIRVGSRVMVRGRNGERRNLTARVTSITPALDPTARTGAVEVIVPNRDARFLPGQFVTMDISTGRSVDTLRIPTRALRYRTPPSGDVLSSQAVPFVWIAEPIEGEANQYMAREVPVKVGLSDSAKTEILSGLEAGQKVIVAGQDYLKNGDIVSEAGGQVVENRGAAPADSRTGPAMPGMKDETGETAPATSSAPAPKMVYTCLMHPEIVQDTPGDCPKCQMKLIPKRQGETR